MAEAWVACAVLNLVAFLFMMRIFRECASAMSAVMEVFHAEKSREGKA